MLFRSDEFSQFDTVISYLISAIFTPQYSALMALFRLFTGPKVLIVVMLLVLSWIMLYGRNRLLEVRFLFITILGGAFLGQALKLIFHRVGPDGYILTFPSQQALLAVVVYGFASYMVLRHARKRRYGILLLCLTPAVCLARGLSVIFFHMQYPSDVLAGYVFGGVWLSLNIVMLEVFRVLPRIQEEQE